MVEYKDFKKEFIKELNRIAGSEAEIRETKMLKVNAEKEALTLRFQDNQVAPVIYFDQAYEQYVGGESIPELAETTYRAVKESARNADREFQIFSDSEARERLYTCVIGQKDNEELLKTIPHEKVEDLAIVARYRINQEASCILTNDMCRSLQMTPEEVMQLARHNTNKEHVKVETLQAAMGRAMGIDDEDYLKEMAPPGPPIYVMSIEGRVADGAAAITNKKAMREAEEMLGEPYYVLPSSRHEVLLVPKSMAEPEELRQMVREVNRTEVAREDVLSDQVYEFSGRIRIAGQTKGQEISMDVSRTPSMRP